MFTPVRQSPHDPEYLRMRSRVLLLATALLAGIVLVPMAAYVWGGRLAGPYAGTRGLASYLGALYADAAQGRLLAWLVLAGPVLAVGVWPLRSFLLRRSGVTAARE